MEVLLEIEVFRAQFLENWYVGDPEDQEDTDFDDDLEVRGRASGVISCSLDPSHCEEISEHLESEDTIESLGEWIEEVYSGVWSSEITNLEQNVSESQLPRDREDEHLSWATIDLSAAGSISSVCLSEVGTSGEARITWKAEFDNEDNCFKESNSDQLFSHDQICAKLAQALKNISK